MEPGKEQSQEKEDCDIIRAQPRDNLRAETSLFSNFSVSWTNTLFFLFLKPVE